MKKLHLYFACCATLYLAACTQNPSSPKQTEEVSADTPSSTPEKTAESATNLNFEHFGSFDLSTWTKRPLPQGDDEDDFTTEAFIYEKEGVTLEISESEGEYGRIKFYELKGADGKVQKVRSLNFNNDVLEAEEIVNDYTVEPGKKYTRTQKMATSTFEMKSIPTKLSGAWGQGPADELQK